MLGKPETIAAAGNFPLTIGRYNCGNIAFSPTTRPALHASQPIRHGSRIKSHTSSHPERRDPSGCGLLEDRHLGHGEEFCQILSGQGSTDLLDLICDLHTFNSDSTSCTSGRIHAGMDRYGPVFVSSRSNGVGFIRTIVSQLQS
jgi:hypothetical protein